MAKANNGMTCFRLSPEIRAAVDALCEQQQLSISEFYRNLTNLAIGGQPYGVSEGYMQARNIAIHLAHALLQGQITQLPDTFEEAVARYGITSTRIE